MQHDKESVASPSRFPAERPGRLLSRNVCAGVLFLVAFACVAQDGQPAAGSNQPGVTPPVKANSTDVKKLTRQEKAVAADGERKKQITDESTQLLTMAIALKAEVDKTNKDTLSINVIRKADEIERLAHNVKEKIKQSGPS